ncbi:MAG: DUF3604 domain-containing protein [Candidatus Latescibacteria bacterium]|jgi:hypothetical protein|nr:DUF3604 domain-containing protein [Candidatus Latescibacterota bacterium]
MVENLYWGDLHNHNELGYGMGSLERTYEIARSHLDFIAFTPHGLVAGGRAPDGIEVVKANWDRIQRAAAEQNTPGTFTCFLGYEWHSGPWGDVHVVCLDDDEPMCFAQNLGDLQSHYRSRRAILIPHHTGYVSGVDWDLFDNAISPVVEIYSEHGCSERDQGPFPMLGHSGGPGSRCFTAQHGLSLGKRFGFVASTDNHDGFPGGYGWGLAGVWAAENIRESIWDAIASRRTIAVTGDRISVDMNVGEHRLGSEAEPGPSHDVAFEVVGWDTLRLVELVRDNVPVQVWTPDYAGVERDGTQRYRFRIEYGWGSMKAFQIFDWTGAVTVDGGEISAVVPCFSSDPFDEHRRKKILEQDRSRCRWQSHTSRGGMFASRNTFTAHSANDALCLEVEGTPETRVEVDMHGLTKQSLFATSVDWAVSNTSGSQKWVFTIGELLDGRLGYRMGKPGGSVVVHRAVPEGLYRMSGGYRHPADERGTYYLRVTQENGQMAWSSPVWIG